METDIVEKKAEYVPLFEHKVLEKKYENLLQAHESLMKTVELLKSTLGFTLDLVNKQEQKFVPKETIQDWENNIGEMQKRIWRNQGNESCQRISLEEPGATNPSLSTREDSLPEVHMKGSTKKRSKKREKNKKEDSLCDEKMVDDADKITPQDHADMSCSQEKMMNRKRDRNSLEESNIADLTVEQGVSIDVNVKTQNPKPKRKKKRKTKAMDVDKPLRVVSDAEIGGGEEGTSVVSVMVNLKSKEDKDELRGNTDVNDAEKGDGEEGTSVPSVMVDLKSEEDKEELRENTDIKLSENVVQTQIPKAKKRKKKKTKVKEVCDPLGSVQVVETTKKEKEDPLGSGQVVETTKKEKEDPLGSVQVVETTKKEKEDPLGNVQVVETTKKEKEDPLGSVQVVEIAEKEKEDPLESIQAVEITEKEKEDKTGELVRVGFEGDVKTKESDMKEISIDHVFQGVSPAAGDLQKCPCEDGKKLIIFDLNGILGDVVQGYTGQYVPDSKVSHRSIFRRPFVSDFLDFCFERFDVAIWSSRRIGLDHMVNVVMGNHARNLVLCFDQNKCILTDYKTLEKKDKPLFLKDLRRVWDNFEKCNICGNRKYSETNTLLVDDSPDKALSNPPHTAIFPYPYKYTDSEDSALGPEGELKKYLERLADADNVQKFVAENPFGQAAITETHESWDFYSKVVEVYK